MFRSLIALLIALAVATAPIGAALAAASATGKSAMHDCHGKKQSGDTQSDDQSCCGKMSNAPDACGFKCCKLIGMIVILPLLSTPQVFLPETVEAQKAPDRLPRPPPPPPRS